MKSTRLSASHRLMAIAALSLIDINCRKGEQVFAEKVDRDPLPDYLDIRTMDQAYCQRFDIFFDGVQVRGCAVVDVKHNRILQFKRVMGNVPVRDRNGRYETRILTGKVEIRYKREQKANSSADKPGAPEASGIAGPYGGHTEDV